MIAARVHIVALLYTGLLMLLTAWASPNLPIALMYATGAVAAFGGIVHIRNQAADLAACERRARPTRRHARAVDDDTMRLRAAIHSEDQS